MEPVSISVNKKSGNIRPTRVLKQNADITTAAVTMTPAQFNMEPLTRNRKRGWVQACGCQKPSRCRVEFAPAGRWEEWGLMSAFSRTNERQRGLLLSSGSFLTVIRSSCCVDYHTDAVHQWNLIRLVHSVFKRLISRAGTPCMLSLKRHSFTTTST